MTQKFDNLVATDYIDTGLTTLKERDMTALTAMSGENDPTDPPEDAVYDNTTSGVLRLNGNTLIDYRNGYLNSTILATNYQPLNSVLTSISEATLDPSCIVTTDGTVSSVSNYGTLIPNMSTPPGAGNLSTRNSIYTGDVGNSVVTSAKLDSSIALVSPFKLGSIIYSFTGGNRSGFLKLAENATMGSSLSNATYRRDDYYNLFAFLWNSSSAVLYGLDGQVVQKGSSAYDDFASNKAILLPTVSGNTEPVTFNYTGNVQTYNVPSGIHKFEIDCVGAAGNTGPVSSDSMKGKGGRVRCTLSTGPMSTLYIYVGGMSTTGGGGWNGGGTGLSSSGYVLPGGGGASDIRYSTSLESRLVVAGGGGAGYYYDDSYGAAGGNGGGLTGGNGNKFGGSVSVATGGSQSSGGTGGRTTSGSTVVGSNGSVGEGGAGTYAPGGGGGYYGGGGGAANLYNALIATGAGGSSYTDPTLCTEVVHTQGYENATGNGWITITPIGYSPNAYIKY